MKPVTHGESSWISVAFVAGGFALLYVSGALGSMVESRIDSLVASILGTITFVAAIGLMGWGLVLAGRARFSFQLEGETLVVCRRTLRRHDIFRIPISEITRVTSEGKRSKIDLANGETVVYREPLSDFSNQALSVVCSIVANRDHSG